MSSFQPGGCVYDWVRAGEVNSGKPRGGDIDEEFDRSLLERLEKGELEQIVDMPDREIELAGNGNHEVRNWRAVAGAMAPANPTAVAYEAVQPWITGMRVAEWPTSNGSDLNGSTQEAQA